MPHPFSIPLYVYTVFCICIYISTCTQRVLSLEYQITNCTYFFLSSSSLNFFGDVRRIGEKGRKEGRVRRKPLITQVLFLLHSSSVFTSDESYIYGYDEALFLMKCIVCTSGWWWWCGIMMCSIFTKSSQSKRKKAKAGIKILSGVQPL